MGRIGYPTNPTLTLLYVRSVPASSFHSKSAALGIPDRPHRKMFLLRLRHGALWIFRRCICSYQLTSAMDSKGRGGGTSLARLKSSRLTKLVLSPSKQRASLTILARTKLWIAWRQDFQWHLHAEAPPLPLVKSSEAK